MAQYNAYPFQQKTIESLVETFKSFWQKAEMRLNIILKSPTGSGKTYMTTHFINALNSQPDWDDDVAFVWITFSDNLAMQSRDKFVEYFFPNISNALLTVADINHLEKLAKGDILFINWQKVTSRRAEDRKLRRPDDENSRKESGSYFEDIFEATHAAGRKLVMIVDESHTHTDTELSKDVIDIINPKIILKVSATPFKDKKSENKFYELRGRGLAEMEDVARTEVVEAGLIKEEIVTQTEEDLAQHQGQDKDKLMLDLAIAKRRELAEAWQKAGANINPLVLIQLPNDDKKLKDNGLETKEEVVLKYLKQLNIPDERIDMWFDNHELKHKDTIADADCPIDFMLFKQAAGTGWDCPRAHILVMYREIKSAVFHTQTLGRIMRMPYNNANVSAFPALKKGYLFTNYDRNAIQSIPEGTENKPKTVKSELPEQTKIKFAETQFIRNVISQIKNKTKEKAETEADKDNIAKGTQTVATKAKEIAKTLSEQIKKVETSGNDDLQKTETIRLLQENTNKAINEVIKEQFDESAQLSLDEIRSETDTLTEVVQGKRECDFVLDPCLISDYNARADYNDLGKTRDFQKSFIDSMNRYFNIDTAATSDSAAMEKLKNKGIDIERTLYQDIIANAVFKSEIIDNKETGKDVKYDMSDNDATKNFTFYCYAVLGDYSQTDDLFGNVARSYPLLKTALRLWFSKYALVTYSDIDYYKVFIKDIQRETASVFRSAINQALNDYRETLAAFRKQKSARALQTYPFVIKTQYLFSKEYTTFEPSKLCIVENFCLPESYKGRENETEFIKYLEQQTDTIEWWFKNGIGKEALGFKYTDSQQKKERIFYPDWIIKYKNGDIGIFDTKGGITASSPETKDKAEELQRRIAKLNKVSEFRYFGGIVVLKNGIWLYNDKAEYSYRKNDSSGWTQF